MGKKADNLKTYWRLLGDSVNSTDRNERYYTVDIWMGRIIALVGGIMTIMNILQHKGFVTLTTAVICFGGIVITLSVKALHNRIIALAMAMFICVVIFTYYTVKGVNDVFAVLWTMLVPLAFCYFASIRYGILISIYYEIMFIVLFYTPLRANMEPLYGDTFMNRFPILYFCGIMLNSIAIVQYHVSLVQQKLYEEKLKKAAEAAIAADSAKSHFLAQMSHEIRTPINAVLGMNEMILREADDERIVEYAENIDSAGNSLLTLINSILDFSKIEDGKMELIPVEYEIAVLVNDLAMTIEPLAKEKGLNFNVVVDELLPHKLYGDDMRISQTILNLLTNAVKYTDNGGVTVSVKRGETIDRKVEIIVAVSDTGIGIRKEDLGRLLLSFERLDEVKNRHIEGTGLGMAIVTRLLDLMGTKLSVESEYGKGSIFSFVLLQEIVDNTPVGNYKERVRRSDAKVQNDELLQAPGARILVVDDNDMNLKVLKNLLKLCNIAPDLATSGEEAIRMMGNKVYDIVFLDHMMPHMDGIETLQKLKEGSMIPDETTMVALTANAVVGAREEYLENGFDDYLSKPVEIERLCEKLKLYLPETAFEGEGISRTQAKKSAKRSGRYDLERLDQNGIRTEVGLDFCKNEKNFYFEILDVFAKAYEEKRDRLSHYYEEKDWKNYHIVTHSLKSAAYKIGAMLLGERAEAMEKAAVEGNEVYIERGHEGLLTTYRDTIRMIGDAKV